MGKRALPFLVAGLMTLSGGAQAQEFLERTFLLDAYTGSKRSSIARGLSNGGYELSSGRFVDLARWYTPDTPEVNFLFLTQVRPDFGITWGFSSGESGEKYRIDPGLWLGFVYQMDLGRRSSLALSALTLLGGEFREGDCLGDYLDQGVQRVNCRLAASVLPPAETLAYLVNERGTAETRISLKYDFRF